MTESPEGVTAMASPSLFKWPRAIGLLLMLVIVLLFVGRGVMVCIAEVGVYLWDDDLVEGGHYLALAKRGESTNRMRSLGMSTLNFHDTFLHLPANGQNYQQQKVEHSWLTWALYLSWQSGAGRNLNVSKSWDDPANFDTFRRRIKDYEIPNRNLPRFDERGYALSHIAGNDQLLGKEKPRLDDITDGTSNTLLAGTAAGKYEPWGKPGHLRDLTRGINRAPEGFGSPWSTGGAIVVMADGSVRTLSNETSPEVLRAMATPSGGEYIDEY
jgi:hypothetical protein